MIPLLLELTNFLSYRDTTRLEFEGIDLACISGLNGAGKSSLLDAMTWALFGKSRSRSDDDIINRVAARNGQAAEVRFTFDLEGIPYRIIRQKQQGRTTVLEFQMGLEEASWRTMSEGGVRNTQAAIEELLRMNFETFINASFFLQGQADEFTTKTPGQRKEILADLLSVNLWDRYKEAAADRRKKEQEKLVVLDARLQEIEGELQTKEEREAELAAAQEELEHIGERLAEKEKLQEQMRRMATAVKQQRQQVQNLHESLTRARARLERLQQTHERRKKERQEYQALLEQSQEIEQEHAAWQEADAEVTHWQEKAEAYRRLQAQRRPHELALQAARSKLEERVTELQKRQEQVTEMRREEEEVAQSMAQRKATLSQLEEDVKELAQKEEAWHETRSELQRLQSEQQMVQKEVSRLESEAKRIELQKQEQTAVRNNRSQAETALEEARQRLATVEEKNVRLMQAMAERDNVKSQLERLRVEMDKLDERRQKLDAETGGTCPLCGQTLSEEHRHTVVDEIETQGKKHAGEYRQNRERMAVLSEEIDTLRQEVQSRDRLQREVQNQQQRLASAEARLEEIDRAVGKWQEEGAARLATLQEQVADDAPIKKKKAQVSALQEQVQKKKEREEALRAGQKQLSATEARRDEIRRALQEWEEAGRQKLEEARLLLEDNEIAPEAQAALADLDERMEAVEYDEEAHATARQARDELREAPARFQELQQAQAAVKPLQDTLSDLEEQIAEQEETVSTLASQHEESVKQLEAMEGDEGDLRQVEKDVLELREQEVAAHRQLGAAQQRLAVLDDLRRQREEERARRAALTRLIERLVRLEKACGRDGVQALLIEQALPEIETDANELLERLTGGAMRVTFETQRELKSRDALAETLDIHISDAAGERPYENFSGGEQFRVNFAIRLALSRILARRAGARLQTLVVDEGFGSQDPQGRQRLVEAINLIRDDFARILVITHINELRDAFPTRIEVEKTPAGSQITVI